MRKVVNIDYELFNNLEKNNILNQYSSFSELVRTALQLMIEKDKIERYKKSIIEASKDELYIADMNIISKEFEFADFEDIE